MKNENSIFEVPVWFKQNNLLRRIISPKSERNIRSDVIKGTFIGNVSPTQDKKITYRRRLSALLKYSRNTSILSVDSIPAVAIINMLRNVSRKSINNKQYVAVIGHPKLISENWLDNFQQLLSIISKADWCHTVTMRDIYKMI